MKFKNYYDYKQHRKILDIDLLPENDIINNNNITIAIIIPHRNRIDHLNKFIYYINKLSKKNNHYFHLYIIDQNNMDKFNRGLLLNIGYYIAKKNFNYNRYIFHDVDSYPSQIIFDSYFSFIDKNIHFMSPTLNVKYTFDKFFGGTSGFTSNSYEKINGFSNLFFGWGGEDDSIYNRCAINNIKIYRPNKGSYILEEHDASVDINKKKQMNILNDLTNWYKDGIKQLDSYFINYKYFDLNNFIKTYEHNENNLQNNAILLYNYKSNKQLINIYKIDYLVYHTKTTDNYFPKYYVINKINERISKLKLPYFQHKEKPMYISVIEPLIYWNEIKTKIIDTYTQPNKFINNIESSKRIEKINTLLKNEFKYYENNLSVIDLEKTLRFIYDTYNEIIFIRIRNNKIVCAYHIYSNSNNIDWYKNLKYKNKPLDDTINDILEDSGKPYYTVKNPHYQPANNCLLGLDSYYYFEGNPISYVSSFIEMINYTIDKFKNIPDSDLLLNRKDFAYLQKNNHYSYGDLLDTSIINPPNRYWIIGTQSKKKTNLDIPIPSSDEWEYIKSAVKFTTKWKDKKNIIVFRGSSSGCGTDEKNNMRIKIAKLTHDNKFFNVAFSKIVGRIKAYKENINIIDEQKYKYLVGTYLDAEEQSKYKYILNIEGNAQAYRYGTEFRKKSVIINIKSPYYMWFEKILNNKRHFLEITNIDNLEDEIKNLSDPETVAENGYNFSKKYINKEMISTYWYYYMYYTNKLQI